MRIKKLLKFIIILYISQGCDDNHVDPTTLMYKLDWEVVKNMDEEDFFYEFQNFKKYLLNSPKIFYKDSKELEKIQKIDSNNIEIIKAMNFYFINKICDQYLNDKLKKESLKKSIQENIRFFLSLQKLFIDNEAKATLLKNKELEYTDSKTGENINMYNNPRCIYTVDTNNEKAIKFREENPNKSTFVYLNFNEYRSMLERDALWVISHTILWKLIEENKVLESKIKTSPNLYNYFKNNGDKNNAIDYLINYQYNSNK